MSYERLELIDGVTKWDTEKVQHLEDAIIANETKISLNAVQGNWDQNDISAPDYIQNRPCYYISDKVDVIEEELLIRGVNGTTTVSGSLDDYNQYKTSFWDGAHIYSREEYIQNDELYYYFGNGSMIPEIGKSLSDTGENFVICSQRGSNSLTAYGFNPDYDGKDGLYLSVLGVISVGGKKELDENMLPDTIVRKTYATFNDIEEAPTASDFNTLLSILRKSGILATE